MPSSFDLSAAAIFPAIAPVAAATFAKSFLAAGVPPAVNPSCKRSSFAVVSTVTSPILPVKASAPPVLCRINCTRFAIKVVLQYCQLILKSSNETTR